MIIKLVSAAGFLLVTAGPAAAQHMDRGMGGWHTTYGWGGVLMWLIGLLLAGLILWMVLKATRR